MGHLPYLIVEWNRQSTGLMISALVTYLVANDAGTDFYAFAQELIRPASPQCLGFGKAGLLGRAGQRAPPVLRMSPRVDSDHPCLTHTWRRLQDYL